MNQTKLLNHHTRGAGDHAIETEGGLSDAVRPVVVGISVFVMQRHESDGERGRGFHAETAVALIPGAAATATGAAVAPLTGSGEMRGAKDAAHGSRMQELQRVFGAYDGLAAQQQFADGR